MWTVEQTGGGCTADVTVLTDDRTGGRVAVVVTDGNLTAFTESGLDVRDAYFDVGVYPDERWHGDDDNRDAEVNVWLPLRDGVNLCDALTGALAEAGVCLTDVDPHGHSETVHALATALLDARDEYPQTHRARCESGKGAGTCPTCGTFYRR